MREELKVLDEELSAKSLERLNKSINLQIVEAKVKSLKLKET